MAYSKEDKKRYLILQCRYYKGESEPPKNLPEGYAVIWDYESRWVEWTLNKDTMINGFENDIKTLNLKSNECDKTPLTLKALLCNRYLHWGGYAPLEVELRNFESWYVEFYQKWKTNREHRADQRKPGLIAKCRYYKGEEENPWNDCRDGILLWRANFWNWERAWVDGMSNSYNFQNNFNPYDLCDLPIDMHKKYNIPRTLLNYILFVHIGNLSHTGYSIISGEAMEKFIKMFYIKFTPLEGSIEKFFGFYTGNENEYPEGTREGLFAYLESIFHENSKINEDFAKTWIAEATSKKESLKADIHPLTNLHTIPTERLAIALYVDAMVGKWEPYENLDEVDIAYLNGVQNLSNIFYQQEKS